MRNLCFHGAGSALGALGLTVLLACAACAAEGAGVRWRDWNEASFADARRAGKPIFLFITATWSGAAARMEREVFTDAPAAAALNEFFVPIRVDRDRRPDVDARYQEAAQVLGGYVGWPLSLFLTPEGLPFLGGTAFTLEDDFLNRRPGFREYVQVAVEAWRTQREETMAAAGRLDAELRKPHSSLASPANLATSDAAPGGAALQAAQDRILAAWSEAARAPAGQPRFPAPRALEFVLDRAKRAGGAAARNAALGELEALLRGGIHDRLGGGFHRMALDRGWRIPRFEKLLAPNAEMLGLCVQAARASHAGARAAAAGTVRWLLEDMADQARGGFFAAQAAGRPGEPEGAYYTWTAGELEAALPDGKAEWARECFGVGEWGDFPATAPHRNVLFETTAADPGARRDAAALEADLKAMRAARRRRAPPPVDRAILVDANARAISALLAAAETLRLDHARNAALKALDRILAAAVDAEKGAAHVIEADGSVFFLGWAGDEAALALACLDACAATGEARYLEAAKAALERLDQRCLDPRSGLYLDRPREPERFGLPPQLGRLGDPHPPCLDVSFQAPPANALAASALLRLAAQPGAAAQRERERERALKLLAALGPRLGALAEPAASFFLACDEAAGVP